MATELIYSTQLQFAKINSSKSIKTAKKIRSKPKTACKTVKTYKCSHLSSQNPNRSHTVLTSGAYRGFAAIRDQWRRIMAACRDRRETGIQIEKSKNHIGDQIRSSIDKYF